jgi:hypothetical protein
MSWRVASKPSYQYRESIAFVTIREQRQQDVSSATVLQGDRVTSRGQFNFVHNLRFLTPYEALHHRVIC